MTVELCHCPKGAAPGRPPPLGAQPRNGPMLVFTGISSLKTGRVVSMRP